MQYIYDILYYLHVYINHVTNKQLLYIPMTALSSSKSFSQNAFKINVNIKCI